LARSASAALAFNLYARLARVFRHFVGCRHAGRHEAPDRFGGPKRVVSFVMPLVYTSNLDGSVHPHHFSADIKPMNRHLMAALGGVLTLAVSHGQLLGAANALEEYVQTPDSSYRWKITERKTLGEGVVHHLEFVSQTWRGHTWGHHLQVLRPEKVSNPAIAFLFITGDGDGEGELRKLATVAKRAGVMVAILTEVPNQPLYGGRSEDALIAYTLDQYLRTGDETWPLLFPMVKSAVRAMDTLQGFSRQEFKREVREFVVSGASKRGWTTWLTAAADPRVKAIAPMVIDMLNMKAQLSWSERVYGKQSEQIHDYTELQLHQKVDDPPMQTLRAWIDPYSHRSRYTMPKLLLLGTNDPYWTVDSLHLYWGDLPGPKLVYQTPNAGHDLAGGKEAINTLSSWVKMIAEGQPLPMLDWNTAMSTGSAQMKVQLDRPAAQFRLWTAHSADRDFRDEKWSSQVLDSTNDQRQVQVTVQKPGSGYTAFLVEAEVAGRGAPFKLSTEVRVIPDERRDQLSRAQTAR
jgi:PhoPQ-activated pathogenicity-related protein